MLVRFGVVWVVDIMSRHTRRNEPGRLLMREAHAR